MTLSAVSLARCLLECRRRPLLCPRWAHHRPQTVVSCRIQIRKAKCVELTVCVRRTKSGDLTSSWSYCSRQCHLRVLTASDSTNLRNVAIRRCASILITSASLFANSISIWPTSFTAMVFTFHSYFKPNLPYLMLYTHARLLISDAIKAEKTEDSRVTSFLDQ